MIKRIHKTGLWMLLGLMTGGFGSSCDDNSEIIYKDSETDDPIVTRLNVSPRNIELAFTDEEEFTVAVRPVSSKIEWESSNPEIAYVDENNRIIPVGVGSVEFTAKAGDLTDKVTATIHSSIIVDDYAFMEKGTRGNVPTLQIVPESTQYTITSGNENAVSVSGSQISAVEGGISRLSIHTEDGQSRDIVIGVTDEGHTLKAGKGEAYFYDGTALGHPGYDIAVLALSENDVTYTDGGQWGGTGKGLFLKLYCDSQQGTIPNGIYTPGDGEFNYYNSLSYLIDAETNVKETISYGDVDIASDGVTAKLIAGSNAYIVNFSGKRTEKPHQYAYDSKNDTYTNDNFIKGSVSIDHNGTMFYGGYGNGWRFQIYLTSSDYIQIMIWSRDTNKIDEEYPLNGGFCEQGTIGCMGYGYTSLLYSNRTSSYFSSGGTFRTPGFAREDKKIILGFEGTFNYSLSENVNEIGEQRTLPGSITLNVSQYEFNISSERGG
ncbi:Ig-like domain-containing protein [uncultured Bacteroides sp.]|uniref:Ig-like domain-containing protein n=1 Tax=uncultured Bacteroides sp. TaxID=162156 RepID=UPI00262F0CC6|nr:Ig-like domain-containing protein [uncultured Bacteroides sp.]